MIVPETPAAPYRPRHIPALDGVRGLAVLIVFFFHYAGGTHSSFRPMQLFGFLNKGGWSGVVLFFVLSGFLITGILWDSFDDPHWWRKFFARRSLRIFPLYYFVLVLVLVAAYLTHTGPAALRSMWIPALFLENLPHLNAIVDKIPSPLHIFHLWSIAVEEQFYLLWPFLLVLFARRRTPNDRRHAKLLCLAVFLASWAFRVVVWHTLANPEPWHQSLLTQAGALALGGWLALASRGPEWPAVLRLAPLVALLGLAGFLAVGLVSHVFDGSGPYMTPWGLTSISLCFTALVALALRPGFVARCFSAGWLRWLGNYSYGVYVYHMLFLSLAVNIAHRIAGSRGPMAVNAALFLTAAVLSTVSAWLSYNLFEKYFLRLKKYFVPRSEPTQPA